jgi:hypothetical protein
MALDHWLYYLTIEDDVLHTQRYVEIAVENAQTYSIEYTRLFLTTCSEIDVVSKLLCHHIDPTSDATKIGHYHDIITRLYPKIRDFVVRPEQWGVHWIPWQGWQNNPPPTWWSDHNKVKHRRHEHYALANQENVLASLCGLYVVNLFYYHTTGDRHGLPPSKLTPHMFPAGGIMYTFYPDNLFE